MVLLQFGSTTAVVQQQLLSLFLDEPQPTDLKVQPFPSISPIPTTSDSVSSGNTLCP